MHQKRLASVPQHQAEHASFEEGDPNKTGHQRVTIQDSGKFLKLFTNCAIEELKVREEKQVARQIYQAKFIGVEDENVYNPRQDARILQKTHFRDPQAQKANKAEKQLSNFDLNEPERQPPKQQRRCNNP